VVCPHWSHVRGKIVGANNTREREIKGDNPQCGHKTKGNRGLGFVGKGDGKGGGRTVSTELPVRKRTVEGGGFGKWGELRGETKNDLDVHWQKCKNWAAGERKHGPTLALKVKTHKDTWGTWYEGR